MPQKDSSEKAVRDIRRKTRRKFSAEEKIRIVLEGLRGEGSDLPQFVVPVPMLVQAAISHLSAKAAIGPSRVPVGDNPVRCAAGTCCTPDASTR